LIYVDGDDRQDLDEAGPEDREDENVAVDQMIFFLCLTPLSAIFQLYHGEVVDQEDCRNR
jgi:hypothetical protein